LAGSCTGVVETSAVPGVKLGSPTYLNA